MEHLDGAALGPLVWGHAALAACAALYLAWWWIFFRPQEGRPAGARYSIGVACIVAAAVLGVGGVASSIVGLGRLPVQGGALPGWAFVAAAAVCYVALAYATVRLFHRPITTELVLFVAWAALELAVASGLRAAGAWPDGLALTMSVLVAATMLACLACYVLYYRLPPLLSFVDGAVPLALVGAMAVGMAAAIAGA